MSEDIDALELWRTLTDAVQQLDSSKVTYVGRAHRLNERRVWRLDESVIGKALCFVWDREIERPVTIFAEDMEVRLHGREPFLAGGEA
ncbi:MULTISPECIES: hypothetical protein [Halocynthiibacter]|uniref:Uncharacterized protein n=1 Tax=Halocynthiibacter halioticoli TaxID=2986804 RepID=A0AAE3LSN4_9RHOB|nr:MULTISPECIES: hypothetical protein [Halocynthiibacter]MCV6826018.1 hypothetical protein [Halocynthiibacter halioticoli]MCW4059019.1 hypothetical protein [Halocynthiibacter sp. SDUM655004]